MSLEIVMATYNGEKFVAKQIQSLLDQTWTDFSLLIGDDASTDNTPTIIVEFAKKYPDKITFIPFKDNVGANANFARLLDISEADYIMLSDQDDIWLPDKVSSSMQAMQDLERQYGDDIPLLVYSDLIVIDENDMIIAPSWQKYVGIRPKSFTLPKLLSRHAFLGCTLLFNKELLMLSTPIPLEAGMHDYWLTLVATVFGKIKQVDHPTIRYRVHASNVVGAKEYNAKWFLLQWRHNPKFMEAFQQRILKAYARAFLFYKRYNSSLSDSELNLLSNFLKLKFFPFHQELFYRLKYGFFEQTFWQNLALLCASKKMGSFTQQQENE